jgi:hypothetical protein
LEILRQADTFVVIGKPRVSLPFVLTYGNAAINARGNLWVPNQRKGASGWYRRLRSELCHLGNEKSQGRLPRSDGDRLELGTFRISFGLVEGASARFAALIAVLENFRERKSA